MLDRAELARRLEGFRDPARTELRAKRVRDLPSDLAQLGATLVEHPNRTWLTFGATPPKLAEAGMALTNLPATRRGLKDLITGRRSDPRAQVFAALFGELGPHVHRAWDALARGPYTTGYARRAFRAPNQPQLYVERRTRWLARLTRAIGEYPEDIEWLAAWAPHLPDGAGVGCLGPLFAAVIDHGGNVGNSVFEILRASTVGEHEIGAFGEHVSSAFLIASRPEGWEIIERMLLAAQREEGLRQVILNTVDEAHPIAFRRMIALVLEHDLVRFASVVAAAGVWIGVQFDTLDPDAVRTSLILLRSYLDDPSARERALVRGSSGEAYCALITIALEDSMAACERVRLVLQDRDAGRRFAAVEVLRCLQLTIGIDLLVEAIDDADLRVAHLAASSFAVVDSPSPAKTFDALERLWQRSPEKDLELEPIEGRTVKSSRATLGHALFSNSKDLASERLDPYVEHLEPFHRARVAERLGGRTSKWSRDERALAFRLLADPSPDVRKRMLEGLKSSRPEPDEVLELEELLARKSEDLRRGVVQMLMRLDDRSLLTSIDRLLVSKKAPQRNAGIELLRLCTEANRLERECRERAARTRTDTAALKGAVAHSVDHVLATSKSRWTLDDALGLADPTLATPRVELRKKDQVVETRAAQRLLAELLALVEANADREVVIVSSWGGPDEVKLLGAMQWLPKPRINDASVDSLLEALPLRETFETFWRGRGPDLRDSDELEGFRVLVLARNKRERRSTKTYWSLIANIMEVLVLLDAPPDSGKFLCDVLENAAVEFGSKKLTSASTEEWMAREPVRTWLFSARWMRRLIYSAWSPRDHARWWNIVRQLNDDELDELMVARQHGGANDQDLLLHLLGPRRIENDSGRERSFHSLKIYSGRRPDARLAAWHECQPFIQRVRARILDVELARGEAPTEATAAATELAWTGGLDTLMRVLHALEGADLKRNTSYWGSSDSSQGDVLSRILQRTIPGDSDDPAAFEAALAGKKVRERRLLEIAMYAPQWSRHVEQAVAWPGLASAVHWIHAHTKDVRWSVEQEIRDLWTAETNEHTPLSSADLIDGGVDVAWFKSIVETFSRERFEKLMKVAKFASTSGGHMRATLFARAMLGIESESDLLARIESKRHQDSVRAFGLLPLPAGDAREAAILSRYEKLAEFLRGRSAFGSMRQESEKRAHTIAMENLARTAGYPDPIRLEWAMEGRAVADLARGPLRVDIDGVEVCLSIDEDGEPSLLVRREERMLKSPPTAVKKDPRWTELSDRKRKLVRQRSRMRESLEQSMTRGDVFHGRELRALCVHPLLAPLLARLVLVGDGISGYPISGGTALRFHDGREQGVAEKIELRIAHPLDLLESGVWHAWQRDCFAREIVQPFKQVFRELYVLTADERSESKCRRYAGHQVQPARAHALLGKRGWVAKPEEGVRKVFHAEGLAAWLTFQGTLFTPADVEGATLEEVVFTKRGEYSPLPLAAIPPRILSESLRDLDLVVSVAHRAGIDPEASLSSIESRAALVRETCALLGIHNVVTEARHAIVSGKIGHYLIHLGSGTVHMIPGGHLCIVPVNAHHRGRLFLPFTDEDPRSAEVLSKVLMLARDHEIKDPDILAQIRR